MGDEEIAERIVAMQDAGIETPKSSGERAAEWSAVREGLARVEDAVNLVATAVIASAGGKVPKLPHAQRPVTAVQRVRQRHARSQHLSLVKRLLPDRG